MQTRGRTSALSLSLSLLTTVLYSVSFSLTGSHLQEAPPPAGRAAVGMSRAESMKTLRWRRERETRQEMSFNHEPFSNHKQVV